MPKDSAARRIYRAVLNAAAATFGPRRAKVLDARFRFGRCLDLDNPETLADKISWIELNADQALAARCTDKFAVRGYVEEKGLGTMLIPCVGGPWDDVSQIDIGSLPERFVLKATHGCEMNYICKDKGSLDVELMLSLAREWLSSDYPRSCVEPHYKLIQHRLYAEEFVGGMDDTIDYKLHCINGEPRFILTCSNRERSLKLNLYDLDWHPMSGLQGPMRGDRDIARPKSLSKMIKVAKTLAEDFDFVRVDLYEKDGEIFFGELTFSPAGGVLPYFSDGFIKQWGDALRVRGL